MSGKVQTKPIGTGRTPGHQGSMTGTDDARREALSIAADGFDIPFCRAAHIFPQISTCCEVAQRRSLSAFHLDECSSDIRSPNTMFRRHRQALLSIAL